MTSLAGLLFLAFLSLAMAAWVGGPPLLAAWRRGRVRRQPFPPAWREILRRRMPLFARLPVDQVPALAGALQNLTAGQSELIILDKDWDPAE